MKSLMLDPGFQAVNLFTFNVEIISVNQYLNLPTKRPRVETQVLFSF
jgi:hypothetical protein